MLTKEAVIEYAEEFLKMEGYRVDLSDLTSDLVLKNDDHVLKVVAMGAVNDAGSTSKKGKGFNKNQIRINLGLALYEVSRQMTADIEGKNKYLIVIPHSKIYEKLAGEIREGIKVLGIRLILTSEMGLIKAF